MQTHRGPNGLVQGYLLKTAQNLSTFQRKQFYRRFYELDVGQKRLSIFGKQGGPLKDSVKCTVKHVVTNLWPSIRFDYQSFFQKGHYTNLVVETPKEYSRPFAVFMEDDSLMVLWAASDEDFCTWTSAFRELCRVGSIEDACALQSMEQVPLPELTDFNYFVGTLYLCLLPEHIVRTNLDQLESARSAAPLTPEDSTQAGQVVASQDEVGGWLTKTVQDVGMFGKQKFTRKYFKLNAVNAILLAGDDAQSCTGVVFEFHRTKLVLVDTSLSRLLPPNSPKDLVLPTDQTDPIGLVFSDGNVALFWARPGKDLKIWTRAFQRFIYKPQGVSEVEQCATVWLSQRQGNAFALNLYQLLAHRPSVPREERKSEQPTEGWLCKTTQSLPSEEGRHPFEKAYCVLDEQKNQLLLCDRTNGEIAQRVDLKNRLEYIQSDLLGKVGEVSSHPFVEKSLLQQMELPLTFVHPFALFFANGELLLMWANSEAEKARWVHALSQLAPQQAKPFKYLLSTKQNAFLVSLYACLARKEVQQVIGQENTEKELSSLLYECAERILTKDSPHFTMGRFELSLATQKMRIFSSETNQLAEEVNLSGRIIHVTSNLRAQLRVDSDQILRGYIEPEQLGLPPTETAPFAIHFRGGSMMLLWAQTQEERQKWVSALEQVVLYDGEGPRGEGIWLQVSEDNQFQADLFRCLIPEPSNEQQGVKCDLSAKALVAVAKVEPYLTVYFRQCDLRLCEGSFELQVTDTNSNTVDTHQLRGKVRRIVTDFEGLCVANQVSLDGQVIDLPKGKPMALLQTQGSILLLWFPCPLEWEQWRLALVNLQTELPSKESFLLSSSENKLTASLYQKLQGTPVSDKPSTPQNVSPEKLTEESKSSSSAAKEDNLSQVRGYMTRTTSKPVNQKEEAFLYRFYRLDLERALLSEYQDSKRVQKLTQFPLLRRVVRVETNLSNELKQDFREIFSQNSGVSRLGENFQIPNANMRSIVLHMVDGDILFFWASKSREFDKWVTAFSQIVLPLSELAGQRQRIWTKLTSSNCFAMSLFWSIKPLQVAETPVLHLPPAQRVCKGWCMKTAQDLSFMQSDFAFRRFFAFDFTAFELTLSKTEGGKTKDAFNLLQLSWVESGLSPDIREGAHLYYKKEGLDCSMLQRFMPASEFKHPLLLCFLDGTLALFWFQSASEHQFLTGRLTAIADSVKDCHTAGAKYLRQTPANKCIVTLSRVLSYEQDGLKDPHIVKGILQRATQKKHPLFSEQFAILDTRIGVLSFFEAAHGQLIDSFQLDFVRCLTVLKKNVNQIDLGHSAGGLLRWAVHERPFALLVGGQLILLMACSLAEYQSWTTGFLKLENSYEQEGQEMTWVDEQRQPKSHITFVQLLQPSRAIFSRGGQRENGANMSAFLCKTSNLFSKASNKIFYKRLFSVDFAARELQVRQKEGTPIKEVFSLKKLVCVHSNFKESLRAEHRQTLKSLFGSKVVLPREFPFPFALCFEGGEMQLLWAPSSKLALWWVSTLECFLPAEQHRLRLHVKSPSNLFLATLTMCLLPLAPPLLLETQFSVMTKTQGAIEAEVEAESDVDKELMSNDFGDVMTREVQAGRVTRNHVAPINSQSELAAALLSAKGINEGWLFKTSQVSGILQKDVFHKRYYRLNLLMEQLKVFDKPEGALKHTLDLHKNVLAVESDLQHELTGQQINRIGERVRLPLFKHPFAVVTPDQILLLWAESEREKASWVQAFEAILQGTPPELRKGFRPILTKKNKFVFQLFECLQEIPDARSKRSKTQAPSKRRQPLQDQSQAEQENQEQISGPLQIELSNVKAGQADQSSPRGNIERAASCSATKSKADLQKQLAEIACDDEKENFEFTRMSIEQKEPPSQLDQTDPTELDKDQLRLCAPVLETESRGKDPTEPPPCPGVLEDQTQLPSNLVASSKEQPVEHEPKTNQTVERVDEYQAAIHSPHRKMSTPSLHDRPRRSRYADQDPSGAPQPQKRDEFEETHTFQSSEKRPGRSYKALAGSRQSTGPIKIKKLITSRKEPEKSRQSLQSVFLRRQAMAESQNHANQPARVDKEDSDQSKDELERDPAAELIKSSFRRDQSGAKRKITVKIRGKSSSKNQLPLQESFRSSNNGLISTSQITPASDRRSGAALGDFESKVKTQIDHDFISNLIKRSATNKSQFDTPSKGGSVWDGIASGLRMKIKDQAKAAEQKDYPCGESSVASARTPVKPPHYNSLISHEASARLNQVGQAERNLQRSVMLPDRKRPVKALIIGSNGRKPPLLQAKMRHDSHRESVQADTEELKQEQEQEKLSDWDADSNQDGEEDNAAVGLSASRASKRRQGSLIVNVRDKTSGLANVFTGFDLSQVQASNFILKTQSNRPSGTNSIGMKAEQRVGSKACESAIPNPFQNAAKQPDTEQQEEEEQIEIEVSSSNNPYFEMEPPNENDCLAESVQSVWD